MSSLVLAVILALPSADPAPTRAQIAQWVKDLGDNNFEVREAASKRLWQAGEAAEPAVLEALKSDDAEVRRRAGELAEKFRWGIYPDTPPKVLDLIGRYRNGDENAKLGV
ncbi:MAG TPA: hypothetical protein VFA26_01415, partial [Gemmataceae bacterium]|nr:hypothetical protein [Gemmataceae bacterium]